MIAVHNERHCESHYPTHGLVYGKPFQGCSNAGKDNDLRLLPPFTLPLSFLSSETVPAAYNLRPPKAHG